MQAQLQKAVVDYEQGQTYPPGSKERTELLAKGLVQFEDIYKKYRTQLAGLTARMWQGKCYEEQGELGPAMGIYNELMEHADSPTPAAPALRRLLPDHRPGQAEGIRPRRRRGRALAPGEQRRPRPSAPRTAWASSSSSPRTSSRSFPGRRTRKRRRRRSRRSSTCSATSFATRRRTRPRRSQLLKKYKPNAAANATDVARLNYDDALAEGEQALAAHEWERAGPLLKQAIRRAEAVKDIDKINYARYNLAFCYYMEKRYYEAVVIADHLARRYPQAGLSAKAAEIGMAALVDAYNTYTQVDRATDLNNLIELAKYTAETYPEIEQGDAARLTLGQIYHGTGKYDKAIEAFEAVRPKSSKFLEGQTRMGGSYWKKSQLLRRDGKTAEADAAQSQGRRHAPGGSQGPAGRRQPPRRPRPDRQRLRPRRYLSRHQQARGGRQAARPARQGADQPLGRDLRAADRRPAARPHRHRPGRPGDGRHGRPGEGRRQRGGA